MSDILDTIAEHVVGHRAEGLAAVEAWNARVHVGDPVDVTLDSGEVRRTVAESGAWMLGGHTPVVMLEGIRGCYLLSRCVPRNRPGDAAPAEEA